MNRRFRLMLIISFPVCIQLYCVYSFFLSPDVLKQDDGPTIELMSAGIVDMKDRVKLLYRTCHIRENSFVYSIERESVSNRCDIVKWHRFNRVEDSRTYQKHQIRVSRLLKNVEGLDLPDGFEIDFFYNENPLSYIYRVFLDGEKIIIIHF